MKKSFKLNGQIVTSLFLLGLTIGCSSTKLNEPSKNSQEAVSFPVIDAHTHTSFKNTVNPFLNKVADEKEYFAGLASVGAVGAIAHTIPTESKLSSAKLKVNDLRNRGILNCLGVNSKETKASLEQKLSNGRYACIKVYLGYVYQYAFDKNYEPVYEAAQKYKIPVVFHTGDTSIPEGLLKYADPLTLDEVAVRHPKLKIVIAHCGYPWYQSAAEVAYKNENVYLEGSAFLIGDLSKYSPEKVNEMMIKPLAWIFTYVENPKKLMYGTDWPLTEMKPYFEAFKKAIPKEHWRAVFYDNAREVFGFPLDPRTDAL